MEKDLIHGNLNSPSIFMDKIHDIKMHLRWRVVTDFEGKPFQQQWKMTANSLHGAIIEPF
jgi:hypothetical protein